MKHQTMTKCIFAILTVFACLGSACGSYDSESEPAELGSAEQAITVQETPGASGILFGYRAADAFTGACTGGQANCQSPTGRIIVPDIGTQHHYCTNDSSLRSSLSPVITELNSLLGQSNVLDTGNCTGTEYARFNNANVLLNFGALDVRSYAHATCDVQGQALSGSFGGHNYVHNLCAHFQVDVNLASLASQFSGTNKIRATRTVLNNVVAATAGAGGRQGSGVSGSRYQFTSPVPVSPPIMSNGERCRAINYSFAPSGSIAFNTNQGCLND